MQGHMIAFRAAMTRTGELEKSRPAIISSILALRARFEELTGAETAK